ncbi:TPA: polysaccharide biosynthesis C-terminal domain-containing protein, partial [Yersinia enterocolitica]|nr:polysaccharide biosynthesis C-terminal domain-containing protein [Yersinia enterocolitica]
SIIIFMRSNIAFIETFLGMKSVGIYSVGANLAEMSYFLPMVLVTSFSPILARLRYEAPLKYTIFYKRLLFSMWWGSILIVLSFGALMYIALPYIYGERFEQSKYIFAIQLMTLIPVCMGLGQSIWIINEKKSKIFLIQTVIGAFIAILLSYFLIKNYGIIGAPISTLISQLIQALFLNFFLYRELFNIT